MEGTLFLLVPVLLPLLSGLAVGLSPVFRRRKLLLQLWTTCALLLSLASMLHAALSLSGSSLILFQLTERIQIQLSMDSLCCFFLTLVAVLWSLVGFYSFEYMDHDEKPHRFHAVFLASLGILSGLIMSGNLVTLCLFYALLPIIKLPMVLHTRSRESTTAAIRLLAYSTFGTIAALSGVLLLNQYCATLSFIPGGTLLPGAEKQEALSWIALLMILGFSTRAGMFPLHGGLTAAHPVTPAPVSAVLSGVVTKMGVLGILRTVFYCIGADALRGSWVQNVWISFSLLTVLMGSSLALREDVFKRRLAYSSVSQISYILFGLSTLTPAGFRGAMLHLVFHAAFKITIYMAVGAIIHKTGLTRVSELKGLGKRMPRVMVLFTMVSLGLIGIPPSGGFVSKWHLAAGALELSSVFSILGPAVLLISAILTAAYLLPVSVRAFFPGSVEPDSDLSSAEPGPLMLLPILFLTVFALLGGMFPDRLIAFFDSLLSGLL